MFAFSEAVQNMRCSGVLGQISKSKQFKQILNEIFTYLAYEDRLECIKIKTDKLGTKCAHEVSNRVRKELREVTLATQNVFTASCYS